MTQHKNTYRAGHGTALKALAALLLCVCLFVCWPAAPWGFAAGASDISGGDSSGGDTSDVSGPQFVEGGTPAEEETPPKEGGEAEGDINPYAPPFQPAAEAVYLLNLDTGMVLYEKNANTALVPASLVKMMTCILAMEWIEKFNIDIDNELVVSDKSWIYDELYGKNASTADIRKGETLNLRELLYAALLPSANEAALLLADWVSVGYMRNFMYMMNTRAKALGCTGTWFDDPNGLSELNCTTARDMGLIVQEFMKYPLLVEIAATGSYEMAAHEHHNNPYFIHNTNRLMVKTSPYYNAFPAVAGAVAAGKTGSLGDWQNFASFAQKNGETYVCVVLHSPNEADLTGAKMDPPQTRPALYESMQLYDWAFGSFTVRPALDTDEPVTELKVRYCLEQDSVMLLPSGNFKALLPADNTHVPLQKKYNLPAYAEAPLKAGQVVGSVTLTVAGQQLGSADLMVARDVERNNMLFLLNQVGDFLSSTFVRVFLTLCGIAVVLYAGLVALAHFTQKNKITRGKKPASSGKKRPKKPTK